MNEIDLHNLLDKLIRLSKETEWVEFKHNFHSFEEVGEELSALSNSACLHNQSCGFLLFGIEDSTHSVRGTDFIPSKRKKGNEDAEHWIAQRLNPKVDFKIFEFDYKSLTVTIFQIDAATMQPVDFIHEAYIRVGSIKRKLREFPEKERKIWKKFNHPVFEKNIARSNLSEQDIIEL